jgi:NADH:ubiquinone oxidoreductase subunit K
VERPRIPLWILLLIFILTIWNPASLALHAASSVWNLSSRSTLSLIFLVVRLALTSVGVAAGMALWLRRPGAVWLAKLSLMLFAVEAVVRLSSRVDLGSAPPGTRLPLAVFIVLHNGAWYLYLQISGRVRVFYALESQSRSGSVGL